MSFDLSDPLLSMEDLAALCGVSVETVRWWRKKGLGPDGFRVGRHVRYNPADVREWLEQQQTTAS